MICTAGALSIYELAMFLLAAILGMTPWGRFLGFLITGAMSMILAPILYPLLRAIESIGGELWKE